GRRPRRRPGWLAGLSLLTVTAIGFIDFVGAGAGSVRSVLEATAIALVALIILGWTRQGPAPSMILVGAAYLALAIPVIGWEVPDGLAMIATGLTAIAFGVTTIGPRVIAARTRQVAGWATKAHFRWRR
ncbi:MAG TPA: hypothetical protein VMU95_19635, partial [Trebonia sp.]|nr:hypothetical protein [Trebonia sp.]